MNIKQLTVLLVSFQILDLVTSYFGIMSGIAKEANFLLTTLNKILLIKFIMILLILAIYFLFYKTFQKPERRLFKTTFLFFGYIYLFILINNLFIIIQNM